MALSELERAENILKAANADYVSHEDMKGLFETLADVILKTKDDLTASFQAAIEKALDAIDKRGAQTNADIDAALIEQQRGMNFIYDKVRSLKDGAKGDRGEPGRPGRDGRDGLDGAPGDDGRPGADGSPDTPVQVLAKVRAAGISVDDIQGLAAKLSELDRARIVRAGGMFSPGRPVHVPMVDVFTGDGSTKTFYLSKAPRSLDTVKAWGSDFPHIMTHGAANGFTITGKLMTLNDGVDAPSDGGRLVFEYYV